VFKENVVNLLVTAKDWRERQMETERVSSVDE